MDGRMVEYYFTFAPFPLNFIFVDFIVVSLPVLFFSIPLGYRFSLYVQKDIFV